MFPIYDLTATAARTPAKDDFATTYWKAFNPHSAPKDRAKAHIWQVTKKEVQRWLSALDGEREADGEVTLFLGRGRFKPGDPVHMAVYGIACAQIGSKAVNTILGFDPEAEDETILNPLHVKFFQLIDPEDCSAFPIKTQKSLSMKLDGLKFPCIRLHYAESVRV